MVWVKKDIPRGYNNYMLSRPRFCGLPPCSLLVLPSISPSWNGPGQRWPPEHWKGNEKSDLFSPSSSQRWYDWLGVACTVITEYSRSCLNLAFLKLMKVEHVIINTDDEFGVVQGSTAIPEAQKRWFLVKESRQFTCSGNNHVNLLRVHLGFLDGDVLAACLSIYRLWEGASSWRIRLAVASS